MRAFRLALGLVSLGLGAPGCGSPPPAAPPPAPSASAKTPAPVVHPTIPGLPGEAHFTSLRRITFGGENAEAYWSWSGKELALQSKKQGEGCDRIYRLSLDAEPPALVPVSDGKGATTCSYFLPGDREIIFSSTEAASPECPPPPDRSQGYVWPLYEHDVWKTDRDGKPIARLTDTKGYDAESTVCQKDGSIVFTSVRDGDLELYRMDKDGKNVVRLTHTDGYDGGAFFSPDCSKIVWRASRPTGKELDDYKALLAKGIVRPTKLELYVANADGSEAKQITYLGAASFGPSWFPSGKRLLFSSNYGDPKGREFDIFAIDETGANLERITHAPGFDGFPLFSPDGKSLAFSSNRATPPGSHDTDVFVAEWREAPPAAPEAATEAAGRVLSDIGYLADPKQEGRGIGTAGLERSGAYLEGRMKELGLAPAGDPGSYRQSFPVVTSLEVGPKAGVVVAGTAVPRDAWLPLGFSKPNATVAGELVFAGYGISIKKGHDDYATKVVGKKIVVVRRFVPETSEFSSTEAKRHYGDLRFKTWLAKQKGALALIVVDDPEKPANAPADWKPPDEARLPSLAPEGYGDAGIPAIVLKRAVGAPLIERLVKGERPKGELTLELRTQTTQAFNVVGRLPADPAAGAKLPGTIVVGAHYDHLGHGGRYSLAPGNDAPHVGADDNASGTAALLEIARVLASPEVRRTLRRDVVIAAFSGEEAGLLGSAHFVHAGEQKAPGALSPKDVFAMLNLDMVGRLRENRLGIFGSETSQDWAYVLDQACKDARFVCALANDGGYGPSDQTSFYAAGDPVLHFFTGSHSDYHKPSDTPDKINAGGAAEIAKLVARVAADLGKRDKPLKVVLDARGAPSHGDLRSFNASLGTIPDYAGPGAGKKGVLLSGVRPGGGADKAGMRRGDILVRLGARDIGSVEDLMYVLNDSKPGETVKAVVVRDGKPVELETTFQESQRPK